MQLSQINQLEPASFPGPCGLPTILFIIVIEYCLTNFSIQLWFKGPYVAIFYPNIPIIVECLISLPKPTLSL